MQSYKKQLIQSGLTSNQALIYELLIKEGALRASTIVRKLDTSLSRPMVYLVLDELAELGLVDKNDTDTKVTRFHPAHPSKLHEIAEQKKNQADAIADAAALVIPKIVSDYNLHSNKPGVRFFEGQTGVEKALYETLENTDETIYTYMDLDAVFEDVKELNQRYMAERLRLKVKKNILFINAQKNQIPESELTLTREITTPYPDHTYAVIEIHNDKVTYITFVDKMMTATVIDDPTIYRLHRALFESHWETAQQTKQ